MVLRGFRFGMLLQLAVGPVSLFVLQAALLEGFWAALPCVPAVALVDALFILAAIWGIGALLEKAPRAKGVLSIFGAVVLILFGLNTLLGVFGTSFIPALHVSVEGGGIFWRTALLTASSPLTIVFWAGIFSARMAEDNMTRRELYGFGLGALLSTLVFSTLVVAVGSVVKGFLPEWGIAALNAVVGTVLILFGIRIALRKR